MNRNRIRICGRNTITLPTPAMTPSVKKLDRAFSGACVPTQVASQVAPLSIDLLDLDRIEDLGDGRLILGGIEFDRHMRPLAYHLHNGHPGEPHGRGPADAGSATGHERDASGDLHCVSMTAGYDSERGPEPAAAC